MARLYLTQPEADSLLAIEKQRKNDTVYTYPDLGGRLSVPLISLDRSESFFLDLSRGRIDLGKHKLQNRGRKTVVLVRLDIGGRPHRNPDGTSIGSPHLHLYREGFADRWPFPRLEQPILRPSRFALDPQGLSSILQRRRAPYLPARPVRMIREMESMLERYWAWLKDQTRSSCVG